jgi:hypothetical protein
MRNRPKQRKTELGLKVRYRESLTFAGTWGFCFDLTNISMNRSPFVSRLRMVFPVLLGATLAGLSSCKRLAERMEITETRVISDYEPAAHPDVPSSTRFYDDQPTPTPPSQSQIPLVWDTPPGWKEAPADASAGMAGMRLINLTFGPGGEGECYLSAMPGAAGGLEANLNRWRKQMGLPDMTPEEIAKLPKREFLGREATYVSIEGAFTGMGAAEAKTGYRMVGLVQPAPEFTLFVKMTGPKELVAANEAAFDQFCQSIAVRH